MSTASDTSYDAIIVGGGAAGLMCGIEAGRRGRRVVVLEHNERIGKKILISGGGRCNFTNIYCTPENFLSANPHFANSALARYTPADFIALVEKHRIRYHEKTLGQLFCDRSAHDITAMLEAECAAASVRIVCRARVQEVSRTNDAGEFVVRTNVDKFRAPTLVVATGGLSIPKIGATGLGYDIARQYGLKIVPTRPALVPLTWSREDLRAFSALAGVSADSIVRPEPPDGAGSATGALAFREKLLFTHRGLSGPAVLQASLYRTGSQPIRVDLAPGAELFRSSGTRVTRSGAAAVSTPNTAEVRRRFRRLLAKRLADTWLDHWLSRQKKPPSDKHSWSAAALRALENDLHDWIVKPAGDEGYAKAEVTAGGVDTRELSSTTMEAKRVPGLYFIGEVVDVTGQLGGYNFQWAWASGAAAGRAL